MPLVMMFGANNIKIEAVTPVNGIARTVDGLS